MKPITVKLTYLPLLLLLLLLVWCDRCDSLTDSSLPPIFFPFGSDEGDRTVPIGDDVCSGSVSIPYGYRIFNNTRIYVSTTCSKRIAFNSYRAICFVDKSLK